MKAAVLENFGGPLAIRQMSDPTPGPHDAVVRVEANGICRSDWHAWMGDWEWIGLKPTLPRVMGHEFCGVVEAVGKEVRGFKKGDRVVVPFNHGCGTCELCQAGHQNVCANLQLAGFHYDGGYGKLAKIPNASINLIHLPESVSFVDAASMGCRFMTSFHGLTDQAQVRSGEWVAVHGCGGIGLAAVHISAALGADVIAVDIDDGKLAKAKELGATRLVNASKVEAPQAIQDITKGGADVSVDALGVATTCRNSIMSLRTRGRHLQIGLTTQKERGEVSLPTDLMVAKELVFVGSLGMQPRRYPAMLRMIETGKLKPGKLVGGTVPIEKAGEILSSMTEFGTLGVIVINQW
jgi:D-arabinose 1-dehydrogenase-like Zn-dependent alcohol dehydrogenase